MVELVKTRVATLADVAEFVRGITFKPSDIEDGPADTNVDCLRTKNVQASLDTRDVWAVDPSFVKRPNQYVTEGDILISSANSWNLVGKCSWIPRLARPTAFGGFVTVLRRRDDSVDSRYLFHWFSSAGVQRTIRSFGNQTTNISNLDLKRTASLTLPLPPLDEQRRIAAILDKADELRAKRKDVLISLDALTQGIFQEMFGDPRPSKSEYEPALMGAVCSKITDGTHHSPPIQETGIPYITAKHLKPSGLEFFSNPWYVSETDHEAIYARCDPKRGDVLYIKDGATTGLAAVNDYDFPFSMLSSLALLRPGPGLTAAYLAAWLNSPVVKNELIREMAGAAITRFTLTKIKNFRIPVPPMSIQDEFGIRICALELLKKRSRIQLAELDSLFASLQQRAFAGAL